MPLTDSTIPTADSMDWSEQEVWALEQTTDPDIGVISRTHPWLNNNALTMTNYWRLSLEGLKLDAKNLDEYLARTVSLLRVLDIPVVAKGLVRCPPEIFAGSVVIGHLLNSFYRSKSAPTIGNEVAIVCGVYVLLGELGKYLPIEFDGEAVTARASALASGNLALVANTTSQVLHKQALTTAESLMKDLLEAPHPRSYDDNQVNTLLSHYHSMINQENFVFASLTMEYLQTLTNVYGYRAQNENLSLQEQLTRRYESIRDRNSPTNPQDDENQRHLLQSQSLSDQMEILSGEPGGVQVFSENALLACLEELLQELWQLDSREYFINFLWRFEGFFKNLIFLNYTGCVHWLMQRLAHEVNESGVNRLDLLLSSGLVIDFELDIVKYPLVFCVETGNIEMIRIILAGIQMLSVGKRVNIINESGKKALHVAIVNNRADTIIVILTLEGLTDQNIHDLLYRDEYPEMLKYAAMDSNRDAAFQILYRVYQLLDERNPGDTRTLRELLAAIPEGAPVDSRPYRPGI